jgi:electron transfer flavoprotein-quinone oxidoreductase
MADERFDVVVVGAGPAGAAAALVAARGGLKVALIERGEYPGAKNTFGGVLYRKQIEQLIPEFWKTAPLERTIVEQRLWLLARESTVSVSFRDDRFINPPNCWTGQRSKFDQWFAAQAEAAGAVPIYETGVTDVVVEDGKVVGVVTDREDGELRANVVIIADGVNSLLGKRLQAHREWQPDQVSLAVKEVIALPKEKIQDRFNLDKNEGCTIELVGETMGMAGLGFLYTNTDTLSLGVGVMVSDLKRLKVKPYEVLNGLKQHPMVKRLIDGGEVKEYAGHLIPEGGFTAMPPLAGDGWMICGDAAQMVNAVHREGTNLAVESGRLAGEAAIQAHFAEDYTSASLQEYATAVRKSIIHKDLKKYKGLHGLLSFPDSDKLFGQLPQAVNDALFDFLSVDGAPKRDKQKLAFRKLEKVAGGRMDLVRMALKGWRAMNG